jgi:hypothetical protein
MRSSHHFPKINRKEKANEVKELVEVTVPILSYLNIS